MNTTPQKCTDRPARGTAASGVLLGVWAHPDDEAAYLSAGPMATARAAGQRVVVATATKGEVGTEEPTPLIEQIGQERYRRCWSIESFVDAGTHDRRAAA